MDAKNLPLVLNNLINTYKMPTGSVSVDYAKTKQHFDIEQADIHPASHQKVWVTCQTCKESFLREYRLTNLPHACAVQPAGGKTQLCRQCQQYKSKQLFPKQDLGTAHAICDECASNLPEEYAHLKTHLHTYQSMVGKDLFETPVRLEGKILKEGAQLPQRSRSTDAGYDVYSYDELIIPAHGNSPVHTGIALSCPPGYYYTLDGRSSLGLMGIMPFRGIIDAGYTGEVVVILCNYTDKEYKVSRGDRVAQIILHHIVHADITNIDEFSPAYAQRGTKGWGSSGK